MIDLFGGILKLVSGFHGSPESQNDQKHPLEDQCDQFSVEYRLNLLKTSLQYKNHSKIVKIVFEVQNTKSHLPRPDALHAHPG